MSAFPLRLHTFINQAWSFTWTYSWKPQPLSWLISDRKYWTYLAKQQASSFKLASTTWEWPICPNREKMTNINCHLQFLTIHFHYNIMKQRHRLFFIKIVNVRCTGVFAYYLKIFYTVHASRSFLLFPISAFYKLL